jgi:hypothetical protein
MPGWKSKLTLVAVTLGVASWLGYRAESRSLDAAVRSEPASRSTARQILAPKSRADSFDRLNALRRVAGRSRLTPREEAQCWEIIRGFSVDEVRAYLAEIPESLHLQANLVLAGMLFYRWGQLDPEAAMKEALKPPYAEAQYYQSVVAAWMGRDLEGIMRWAKANGSEAIKRNVGNAAGRLLAFQDPETALARATAEFPSAVDGVLFTLALQMSDSEESRRKFFALLASREDPKERKRCLERLASAPAYIGRRVPIEVAAELEASGAPPDQVDFFRNELERQAIFQNPQGALERMSLPGSDTPRDRLLSAYANWLKYEPEEAVAWAENHGKVDFIAETVKGRATQRIAGGWQPGGGERREWDRSTLDQFNAWRKLEPSAAETWLQTLPSEIRDHFNASSYDATR